MAYPSATLSDYRTECARMVHDTQDVYWSSTLKTAFINRAIQQRDTDTGANRQIIEYELTVGDDTYTFTDLGNTRVFDVVGINLIFNGTRVVLAQRSYTDLNAQARPWTQSQMTPVAWCRYNPTTVIFGPKPGVAYDTEWDCSVAAAELSGDDDTDPLTGIYTVPVPFYASYLCKINERQYEEAAWFLEQYHQRIRTIQGARAGLLPTAYKSQ